MGNVAGAGANLVFSDPCVGVAKSQTLSTDTLGYEDLVEEFHDKPRNGFQVQSQALSLDDGDCNVAVVT